MKNYLSHLFRPELRRIWIMFAVFVLALIGFEEVYDDVFSDPLEGDLESQVFDQSISKWFAGLRTPILNQVMTDLTALGSISVILTLFIVFVVTLSMFKDFKGIGFISIVLLGAGLWPTALKLLFKRDRPMESEWLTQVVDFSFPSGHSFGASATYIGFAYYASLYAKTKTQEVSFFFLGASLALFVGISRIYLGVHFPTDVLAGLAGGVAWGLIASMVYEAFRIKNRI